MRALVGPPLNQTKLKNGIEFLLLSSNGLRTTFTALFSNLDVKREKNL